MRTCAGVMNRRSGAGAARRCSRSRRVNPAKTLSRRQKQAPGRGPRGAMPPLEPSQPRQDPVERKFLQRGHELTLRPYPILAESPFTPEGFNADRAHQVIYSDEPRHGTAHEHIRANEYRVWQLRSHEHRVGHVRDRASPVVERDRTRVVLSTTGNRLERNNVSVRRDLADAVLEDLAVSHVVKDEEDRPAL